MISRPTLVTLALALLASTAAAQSTSPHEATATAAYEAGDLDTALREFEAAYADTQRPDLLYVIGRLHVERQDCKNAIGFFERYLATKPGQTQADAAQGEIAKCRATLDAQLPPPVTAVDDPGGSTPPDTGATTTPVTSPPHEGSRSFASDKLGMTLLVGGLLAEGAAVVLYVQARGKQCGDPVCTELSYEAYLDAEEQAKQLRLTSIIVAGAGAVLLGGGVYRFATRDKRRREPSLSLVPTRDGAALTFGGRF